MNSPVTIVLPVHNAERTLRTVVFRILELTELARRKLRLVIVDDGSTDETFETACELARKFPQVAIFRQPFQRGLGPALEEVRRRLGVDSVLVHDGASPIDVAELAAMIDEGERRPRTTAADEPLSGSRRFAAVSTLNARLAAVHRAASSLRWLQLDQPLAPRRKRIEAISAVAPPIAPINVAPSFSDAATGAF